MAPRPQKMFWCPQVRVAVLEVFGLVLLPSSYKDGLDDVLPYMIMGHTLTPFFMMGLAFTLGLYISLPKLSYSLWHQLQFCQDISLQINGIMSNIHRITPKCYFLQLWHFQLETIKRLHLRIWVPWRSWCQSYNAVLVPVSVSPPIGFRWFASPGITVTSIHSFIHL
jgi:hypothetical protein